MRTRHDNCGHSSRGFNHGVLTESSRNSAASAEASKTWCKQYSRLPGAGQKRCQSRQFLACPPMHPPQALPEQKATACQALLHAQLPAALKEALVLPRFVLPSVQNSQREVVLICGACAVKSAGCAADVQQPRLTQCVGRTHHRHTQFQHCRHCTSAAVPCATVLSVLVTDGRPASERPSRTARGTRTRLKAVTCTEGRLWQVAPAWRPTTLLEFMLFMKATRHRAIA
jgi:hypothetical protein